MTFKERLHSFYKHEVKEPIKDINAALFSKGAEEPFIFSTRAKSLTELGVFCSLLLLLIFTSNWQLSEGRARNKQLVCKDPVRVGLALTYIVTAVVQLATYLMYSARFKKVFQRKELNYTFFRRNVDIMPPEFTDEESPPALPSSSRSATPTIPYERHKLRPTIRALRKTVRLVERGDAPLLTATHFLLSEKGQAFLAEGCHRLQKLRLLDNSLVRIDESQLARQVLFWLVVNVCCTASVAVAYTESDTCSGKLLFVYFLDKFSITLLTVIAIAAFAGLVEYSQLFCEREEKQRLTEDERFIISLIAANSAEHFYGFARSPHSGYANLQQEGEKDVFLPMHMSYFAYKRARTAQDGGNVRLYGKSANDCVGNYYMS